MIRLLVLVSLAASYVNAQDGSGDDAKQLLLNVRSKVMESVDRLPRYLCTETVDRTILEPQVDYTTHSCDALTSRTKRAGGKLHVHTTDRVRLDVAIASDGEMYSWVGADHFEGHSLAELVRGGATSSGVFVSFLAAIFGSDAATFTYNGDIQSSKGLLAEFGFKVPVEKSKYRVQDKVHHAVVGYEGTFLANPDTYDLVHLTIHSDQLPAELEACETTTKLDYMKIRLNDAEFLIPREANWRVITSQGTELDSRMAFSACHEFRAESKLSFDEQAETAPAAGQKQLTKGTELPPGLSFSLAFTNSIDTATAAAGDLLKGRLTSAIKDKRNGVYIPKGANVTGRIVQIERLHEETAESLTIAIRLETIEANGVPQPFHATMQSMVKRRQKPLNAFEMREDLGSFSRLLDPENASVSFIHFDDVTKDFVINRGLQMEGKTSSPK